MSKGLTLKMRDDSLNTLPSVREWLDEVAKLIEEAWDTPNEPYKMPSKEMEATRRYIPKIKIMQAGELKEL